MLVKKSYVAPILVCVVISIVSIILWLVNARSQMSGDAGFYKSSDTALSSVSYKRVEVFPVRATKKQIQLSEVGYNYHCRRKCHATYDAADIGAPEGTQVVAAVSGRVIGVNQEGVAQSKKSGASIRIRGADGLWYYYTHLAANSVVVQTGQVVRAGDLLGVMGSSRDAQGAAPHLHLDVSVVENGFDRGANLCSEICSNLIAPQPLMLKAYLALPEDV